MGPLVVAYISHPVGIALGSAEDFAARQNNLANFIDWVSFLARHVRWSLEISWYAYIVALGEQGKPLGMVHNLAKLERCDFVVQIGGNVSPHMGYELQQAARRNIPNVDLTGMGYAPPWHWDERAIQSFIEERAANAMRSGSRAPWMPPLTAADLETLRDIRRRVAPAGRDDFAQAVIDRIIAAAERHP